METFQISQLSFTYPGQARPALEHISLCVEAGAFLVLCGQSGCGKTTLLRQLKPALTPHGTQSGQILFQGRPLRDLGPRQQSGDIGFVMQSPDNQLVTDKVWHELAFGLESLGLDTPTIRRRVAEMASFFGIESWFHRDVAELSGGQKQLLNLAAVMVMQPKVLLLDEPTSQLDPIAAEEFLSVLGRINRDLGTTVILSEHRLEEALPLATAAAVLDGGRLLAAGPPRQVGQTLKDLKHPMFRAMPAPARIWAAVDSDTPCPFTVRDGRNWLSDFSHKNVLRPLPPEKERQFPESPALEARELWFRYEKEGPDVLRGLTLSVGPGEFLALLGGNGAPAHVLQQVMAVTFALGAQPAGLQRLLVWQAQHLFPHMQLSAPAHGQAQLFQLGDDARGGAELRPTGLRIAMEVTAQVDQILGKLGHIDAVEGHAPPPSQ